MNDIALNSKLKEHYNKLGYWINVDPPRPTHDSQRMNLNKVVQMYGVKTPNDLANAISDIYDWNVENPRLQRVYDSLVVKEWDDFIGCTHFEIIALAGQV